MYYGQTERSLKTGIAEHKKAVASFDQNSKFASHVHQFSHNMNFANVKVVGVESNYPSDFTLKPGTLLLGTITSYFLKPTKVSREHELHGHARNFSYVTLNSV